MAITYEFVELIKKELQESMDRRIDRSDILNPLQNDKIINMTNLKAFADDKLDVATMNISLFDRVENTVGKGKNAGYQHFLLFPYCFPKPSC